MWDIYVKKRKGCAGFTLIEIIVVAGISVVLAGIALGYSRTGRNITALQTEGTKLAQVITRARSRAIATYGSPNPPCGYGVELDYAAGRYHLFEYAKDAPAPPQFPCRNIAALGEYLDGSRIRRTETHVLSSNIGLQQVGAYADVILFLPPEPRVVILVQGAAWDPGVTWGEVHLVTGGSTRRLVLSITSSGQISFASPTIIVTPPPPPPPRPPIGPIGPPPVF